jgi:hypothetical protein
MPWRQFFTRSLVLVVLVIWMAVLFSLGATYLGPHMAGALSPEEASFAGLALLLVCLVDTVLLGVFILNTRIYGWRLVVTTGLIYYGVKTFQANIEALYFMLNLTPDLALRLFTMTLPVAILWPPVAVLLLGKARKPAGTADETSSLPPMSRSTWLWKVALLGAVVYPLLFFGFGYYVAWQNPAVREFYHGTDPGSFLLQMRNVLSDDYFLLPFEILRGLLWTGLAVLCLWAMKDRPWLAGVLLALIFALVENNTHLFPNPLMPAIVRQTHFIETASSNFIFGLLAAALLIWRPARQSSALTRAPKAV